MYLGWTFLSTGYCKEVLDSNLGFNLGDIPTLHECKELCTGSCKYISYNDGGSHRWCYGFPTCDILNRTIDNGYITYKKS